MIGPSFFFSHTQNRTKCLNSLSTWFLVYLDVFSIYLSIIRGMGFLYEIMVKHQIMLLQFAMEYLDFEVLLRGKSSNSIGHVP